MTPYVHNTEYNKCHKDGRPNQTKSSATRMADQIRPNQVPQEWQTKSDQIKCHKDGRLNRCKRVVVETAVQPKYSSPQVTHRKPFPSCLRREWKTTVRVGAFTPMAKVSVQNSTCKNRNDASEAIPTTGNGLRGSVHSRGKCL